MTGQPSSELPQQASGKEPMGAPRTPSPEITTNCPSTSNQIGTPGFISDEVITELYRDLVARSTAPVRRSLFDTPPQLTNRPVDSRADLLLSSPGACQRAVHEQNRDREFEEMKATLRDMTSKIHQVTSSAPELDRVLQETQNTPFSAQISNVPVRYSSKLRLAPYAGSSDPTQYLTAFNIAMSRAQFSAEEREASYCQVFVENLTDSALTWFSRLETCSINNFHQLATAFLKHYQMYIQRGTSNADLWALTQERKEPLRSYIDRFKAIISRATVADDAALPALRNGLWFESDFKTSLKLDCPRSLEDALHRAALYIEVEEEQAAMTEKHAQGNYRADRGRQVIASVVSSECSPDHSQFPRSNEQHSEKSGGHYDPRAYCDFHQSWGHPISQCQQLRGTLFAQYQTGEVDLGDRQDYRASSSRARGNGRGQKTRGRANSVRGRQTSNLVRQRSPSRERSPSRREPLPRNQSRGRDNSLSPPRRVIA